jgi:hypothetical protein
MLQFSYQPTAADAGVAPAAGDRSGNLYEVLSTHATPSGHVDVTIRLHPDVTLHEVIAQLNERYRLTAFHEVLPSMQEVFIETVTRPDAPQAV